MEKMLVVKVERSVGVSRRTGKDFDFTVMTAFKTKPENTEYLKGLRPIEIFCDESFLKKVDNLPAICEVDYELTAGYGGKPQLELTSVKVISPIKLT